MSEENQEKQQINTSNSESLTLRYGKCKWFNVVKGWGFITPEDGGPDVFVHQSAVQMSGFRSLSEGEQLEFTCRVSDKGLEAVKVTGPDGADCKGSTKKIMPRRRRQRRIRCYNCGEFGNHIAVNCTLDRLPKRCHNCKSEEHLIADCPTNTKRKDRQGTSPVEENTEA